jgi:hypothetical protein
MPLRDHFHPPLTNSSSWEELHGMWPSVIAMRLNTMLPPHYRCGVKVHLGALVEVDAATFKLEHGQLVESEATHPGSSWEAAAPTLLLETDELTPPEYEVQVYDQTESRRLVAAVEIVSPRNKDRAEAREAFVSKCHAMLQQEVCVVIVDPVTSRSGNLYADLARRIGAKPPSTASASIYAACCRNRTAKSRLRVESWEEVLMVGSVLPTLPLWISPTYYVPLELEQTYEDTCRGLRIG